MAAREKDGIRANGVASSTMRTAMASRRLMLVAVAVVGLLVKLNLQSALQRSPMPLPPAHAQTCHIGRAQREIHAANTHGRATAQLMARRVQDGNPRGDASPIMQMVMVSLQRMHAVAAVVAGGVWLCNFACRFLALLVCPMSK